MTRAHGLKQGTVGLTTFGEPQGMTRAHGLKQAIIKGVPGELCRKA